jgi:glutathione S-transferase
LKLILGNKAYSSWSMRAWLLLSWLGCDFEEEVIGLYTPQSREAVRRYAPTGLVPVLLDGDLVLWDSLAIVLHMADSFPHVWPDDPAKRAFVRSVCAEMHSSFTEVRGAMPFNCRARGRRVPMTDGIRSEIARVAEIFTTGRRRFGQDGPWLAGEFGIADIMYAPMVSRFLTYGVRLEGPAGDYAQALLGHSLVQRWFADGRAEDVVIPACEVGVVEASA